MQRSVGTLNFGEESVESGAAGSGALDEHQGCETAAEYTT